MLARMNDITSLHLWSLDISLQWITAWEMGLMIDQQVATILRKP